jgi:integration host factor subunit alpha
MSDEQFEVAQSNNAPGRRRNSALHAPSPTTVTRACLADAVHRAVGTSRAEAAKYVEEVLAEVIEALVVGNEVKLSSFGAFEVRKKNERLGRNPRTGVDAKISKRRVVVFRPSNVLRAKINGDRDSAD